MELHTSRKTFEAISLVLIADAKGTSSGSRRTATCGVG